MLLAPAGSRRSANIAADIPTRIAASRPVLYDQRNAIVATRPAATAASTAGRSLSAGMRIARNVSGSAKSRDQLSGTALPTNTPAAVVACQQTHSAQPLPKKNQ